MKVLFSATESLGGKLIRIGTRSDWNHVDLLFSDGTLIGATSAGVQKLTLEKRIYNSSYRTYAYRIDEVEVKDEQKVYEFAMAQLGKTYDYTAVFAFLLPWRANWNANRRWFCSELVAAAIVAGGTTIARMDMHRVTPGFLDTSPLLKTIEGPVNL
jgi:uncharacterized protein YycO